MRIMSVKNYYTDEINAQIIVALLKANNISKIVVSPGTTNIALVSSFQYDSFFRVYSAPEERSAAYMACGLAAESNEPVVLSCTGATASRNYIPGLTEAFYRKLPVLAITSSLHNSMIGHLTPQQIDRSSIQKDIARFSVTLPIVKDLNDKWECEISVNKALLELSRDGGGPVHINVPTSYICNNNTPELPIIPSIQRFTAFDNFPKLPSGRIAIFIGSHKKMSSASIELIDQFCRENDGIVFCDHTSAYNGEFRVQYSIAAMQSNKNFDLMCPDLLIHLGEVSGDYYTMYIKPKKVWRVSEDGELRDRFRCLQYIFQMPNDYFFKSYIRNDSLNFSTYLSLAKKHLQDIYMKLPDLPFSNIWIASITAKQIPNNASIHFGILNSLRSWNFFEMNKTVSAFANVGGFGIDGCVSSLIGASLANKNKLYFGVIGDLALFYDLNSLGNRHIGSNLRIMLINNGKGVEFKNLNHPASKFGETADLFIAAGGHYGNKSRSLIKDYATALGFDYMSASNKEEYLDNYQDFISPEILQKPILFEIFTDEADEIIALDLVSKIDVSNKDKIKTLVKTVIGSKATDYVKSIMSK